MPLKKSKIVVSKEQNKLFDTTANEKGEFESEKAGFQSGKHRLINKKAYPFGYA